MKFIRKSRKPGFWDSFPLFETAAFLLILAFAVIPMVGIYWNSALEADLAASSRFAQQVASQTMNLVLDTVPFPALQVARSKIADLDGGNAEDGVARLIGADRTIAEVLKVMGNPSSDGYAHGELKDERGILYKTKLFVFSVPVMDDIELEKEVTFSYLPRPPYENALSRVTGQPNWFTGGEFVSKDVVQLPYDLPVATMTRNARLMGAAPDEDGRQTVMKRLLFRIRWRDQNAQDRQIEIVSAKANLTGEVAP